MLANLRCIHSLEQRKSPAMHEWDGQFLKVGDPVTDKQLAQAHIRKWLEKTGSIKETAKVVGLHPGALSRKIERDKIHWIKFPCRQNQ